MTSWTVYDDEPTPEPDEMPVGMLVEALRQKYMPLASDWTAAMSEPIADLRAAIQYIRGWRAKKEITSTWPAPVIEVKKNEPIEIKFAGQVYHYFPKELQCNCSICSSGLTDHETVYSSFQRDNVIKLEMPIPTLLPKPDLKEIRARKNNGPVKPAFPKRGRKS